MAQADYHLIKISCYIQKLKLSVRFPCTIFFQLKNQQKQAESQKQYELLQGTCLVSQNLSLQSDILAAEGNYSESKIFLIVMMRSANGKIPAGSIHFKLTQNNELKSYDLQPYSIEKCPDRSAKITMSLKCEFIKSYRKQLTSIQGQKSYSPISMSRIRSIYNPQNKDKRNQTSKVDYGFPRQFGSPQRARNAKYTPKRFEQNKSSKVKQSQPSINSSQIFDADRNDELVSQKGKYKKVNYLREMAKLKEENGVDKWDNEDQLYKYRNQIELLTNELDNIKERNRVYEKRDRQNLNTIRTLRDDVEKIKYKHSQNEIQKTQAQYISDEKLKELKGKEMELKQIKQELEDLKANTNAREKRLELKENIFNEQMKKLSEKYSHSDSERQKATVHLNNLLSEMETNEKRNQLQIKEKDRTFHQEKSALLKKIQLLNKELQKLRQERENNQFQYHSLSQTVQQLNTKDKEAQEEIQKYKEEIDLKRTQIHRKALYSKTIQKELQQLKTSNDDLITLKRKHIELTLQSNRMKELLVKEEKMRHKLEDKIRSTQQSLQLANKQKLVTSGKLFDANRQIQQMKKTDENKTKEIEAVNENFTSSNNKFNEFKTKVEAQKQKKEEEIKRLGEEINLLIQNRDQLEAEVEEGKWKLQKADQNYQELKQKYNESNDQILKLNEDIINLQERVRKLIEENKEQEHQGELLKNQKQILQDRQKQLLEQLKEKTQSNYSLNKITKEREQEIYLLNEKMKEKEVTFTEKIKQKETAYVAKNTIVNENTKAIRQLEIKLGERDRQIQKLTKQKLAKQDDNFALNENIKTMKEEAKKLTKKLQDLTKTHTALNTSNEQVKKKLSEEIQKNKKLDLEFKNMKKQTKEEQKSTKSAVIKLIEELSKDSQPNQKNLLTFSDINLSNLQTQAIRTKKNYLTKQADKIKDLEEAKAVVKAQLEKIKKNFSERQSELQSNINSEKDKNRAYQKQFSSEKSQMMEKNIKFEEKILTLQGENEKLTAELAQQHQLEQDLQNEIKFLNEQIEMLREEQETLEKQYGSYKLQEEKQKISKQNEYTVTLNEKTTMIQRYKQNQSELERKNAQYEKTVTDKQAELRQLKTEISSLNYEKQKLEQKVEHLNTRLEESTKLASKLEEEIKEYEREVKGKIQAEEGLRFEINQEKYKLEDQQIKYKKITEEVENKDLQIEKLKGELQNYLSNISEHDTVIKKIEDKYRAELQKLKQQLKQTQQKLIELNSEIELKAFLISQHQINLKTQKQQFEELTQELYNRKQQILSYQNKLEEQNNEMLFVQQNYENEEVEKTQFKNESQKQKQKIDELLNDLLDHQMTIDTLSTNEKEYERVKDELEALCKKNEQKQKQMKSTITQLKRELSTKTNKEEEYKFKVKELEKVLKEKQLDLEDKIKMEFADEQEKQELEEKLLALQSENIELKNQLQFVRENLEEQLTSTNNQIVELTGQLAEREETIALKNHLLEQYEEKIQLLSEELRHCLEALNRDKEGNAQKEQLKPKVVMHQNLVKQTDTRSQKVIENYRDSPPNIGRSNFSAN